MRNDDAMTVM